MRLREHKDLAAQKVPEAVELDATHLIRENSRFGHRERSAVVSASRAHRQRRI